MMIGFVGTGTIKEAIVTGIASSSLDTKSLVVSPRNPAIASRLAAAFSSVVVARDNQDVVDRCDVVFIAARPLIVRDVLQELSFHHGRHVVGLVAATGWEQLLRWTGGRTRVSTRPIRRRCGYSMRSEGRSASKARASRAAGVTSALMAIAAGVQETSVRWLSEHGMAPAVARAYVSGLNLGIAAAALASPETPLEDVRRHYSTVGGLKRAVLCSLPRPWRRSGSRGRDGRGAWKD
jgi:pyrroline-5-carboxylate reductase